MTKKRMERTEGRVLFVSSRSRLLSFSGVECAPLLVVFFFNSLAHMWDFLKH